MVRSSQSTPVSPIIPPSILSLASRRMASVMGASASIPEPLPGYIEFWPPFLGLALPLLLSCSPAIAARRPSQYLLLLVAAANAHTRPHPHPTSHAHAHAQVPTYVAAHDSAVRPKVLSHLCFYAWVHCVALHGVLLLPADLPAYLCLDCLLD